MRKVTSLIVVLLLVLIIVPDGLVMGEPSAIYLQGNVYDSYDGNAVWNMDGTYSGNITAINVNQPGDIYPRGANDAINDGSVNEGKENEFWWDASPGEEPHEWFKYTPEKDDNIIFLGEYQHHNKEDTRINYTWASNYIADYKATPRHIEEHVVRYEPIPKPVLNPYADEARGLDWMNISIPNFKYTSSTIEGEPTGRGTHDLLQSYAVFIRSEKEEWKYIGNSEIDMNNKPTHDPIPAVDDKSNPNEINTGSHFFLVTDLKPSTYYEFKVRVNFRTLEGPVDPVWGYEGGLGDEGKHSTNSDLLERKGGSVTPFAAGDVSMIPTMSEEKNLASYLQGDPRDSYDENAGWYDEDGFSGNITAININNPDKTPRGADDAINDGTVNEGKEYFYWDASPGDKPHQWYSSPEFGHNIMFLAEYQHYDEKYKEHINYTWVSNYKAEDEHTPPDIEDHVVKYEPIPKPVLNEDYSKEPVGPSWINISIPNFKYTSSTVEGEPTARGTYDLLQSYAVFMRREGYKEWAYLGNSEADPNNMDDLDQPILPVDDKTNPDEINTGSHYFLAENLDPETGYEFKVRVNFRTLDEPVHGKVWGWGYEGRGDDKEERLDGSSNDEILGLGGGTITPFGSRGGGVIPTGEEPQPPSEPKELEATADIGQVHLEWKEPDDKGDSPIVRYNIYRNGFYHDYVDVSYLHYTDSTVTNGVEYTYYVTAENSNAEGPASNSDSAIPYDLPSEPQSFVASSGEDIIEMDWEPPADYGGRPVTEYKIYRDGLYYLTVSASTTSYTDNSVTNGVEYTYYVTAVNEAGEGPPSNSDSAVPYTISSITLTASSSSDGWCFVSLKLIPENTDIEAILNDPTYGISDNYDRVMYYDAAEEQWRSYVPGREDHFNNLQDIDNTMGIWIRMIDDATLTVIGFEPINTTITLQPGWNMVGYPSTITGNNDLPTEITKIGYFDANETYNLAYDYNPGSFNFKSREAYWIYNDADHEIDWIVDY